LNNYSNNLTVNKLTKKSKEIKATCVKMAYNARESHLSSALSCADILTVLFGGWLRYSQGSLSGSIKRDRFVMSKGHGCSAMYSAMAAFGIIPVETLETYCCTDSSLPNHPCKFAMPKLEISSGSLGHGLGIACGMLYGARLDQNDDARAIVLMGDGECNEGSVWEAAMFAAAKNLRNLLAIVDYNGTQAVGRSDDLMGHASLEEKFRSFGWEALSIDGNNIASILEVLKRIPLSLDKPSAIIAKTICGSGVSFMEDNQVWFYRRPDKDDLENALSELGEPPLI
jgi:transketolase